MKKFTQFALSFIPLILSSPLIAENKPLDAQPHMPYQASITTIDDVQIGKENTFLLSLEHADGKPVLPEDLQVVYTERVHVLMIDPSLSDYRHEHSSEINADGAYAFSTTLSQGGTYRVFADIKDADTGMQYYVPAQVVVSDTAKDINWADLAPGEIETEQQVGDLNFAMKINGDSIRADRDYMLEMTITDKDGNLFEQLEPVMEAYAHLVGFDDVGDDILHTHPMGNAPSSNKDRGGPTVRFHLNFDKPGMHRLFAQFQVNGENVFVPIDVNVAS